MEEGSEERETGLPDDSPPRDEGPKRSGRGPKLRETNQMLSSILGSMKEQVLLQDREHTVLWANESAASSIGRTPEELLGRKCHAIWHGKDAECAVCPVRKAWESGEPEEVEVSGSDGRSWYIRGYPLLGKDGTLESVLEVAQDITQRRKAELALLESEERYRRLAESSFEGIVIHEGGVIRDVNKQVCDISGYSHDELVGRNYFDLLDPACHQVVIDRTREDSDSPYEVRAIARDGSTLELEVIGKMIPYQGGMARVSSVRDIGARKRQEEALRSSEERLRSVSENLQDVLWTMDLDLRYTYVSPSVERQRGFTPEEIMQRTVHDLMTPLSLQKVFKAVDEELKPIVAGEGDPFVSKTMELEMYRKDGSSFQAEMTISMLIDRTGRPVGIMGVTRDITDRKEAEEAVASSEARYRLLAENVEEIIFTMTPDLVFDYVSPSLVRFTGYTFDELVEMGWQGLFTPDSLERALDKVSEDVLGVMDPDHARGRSMLMDLELVTKDGGSRWFEVSVSALTDASGEVTTLLGVARDVTERRRTQEQFTDEKKRAELYLDLFGHDIRNINQGIMSYLELVLMRRGLDPEVADYINSVLEQATRINDLVAKVQRLTSLRSREIVTEDVDARKMIHGAIDYVVAKYPDRTIEVNFAEDGPAPVVRGTNLLTDVFTSIIDNGVRFNRNETALIDIHQVFPGDGETVRFMFDDRGPGIPDDMKDRVFKRLDQPVGGVKGSGLGLTVVWEIVKQLDGRIWVTDRVPGVPNQGSRFVVELPRGGLEGGSGPGSD